MDEDGWGHDAPPVTRTQLEKVQSSYQPTKVNLRDLSSSQQEPSRFNGVSKSNPTDSGDVVKGGYQPVGKVDIAALRRQAQEQTNTRADKPEVVKGAYEPVGKVDIAAIRARAQPPSGGAVPPSRVISPSITGEQRSLPDRSAPFSSSERLTSMPKPKVSNRFGAGASNFTGTKAPTPSGFGLDSKPKPTPAPVGVGRTFADEGGKTPAQLWAEKKARERGVSGAGENAPSAASGAPTSPMSAQRSGGGEWKSGYSGKSWAPVQTTKTGQSGSSLEPQITGQDSQQQEEAPASPTGGIGAIRDRFKDAPPMGATATGSSEAAPSPPPLDTSTKPNASRAVPMPGLPTRPTQSEPSMPEPPPQPPRSPTPPTPPAVDSGSPIRVAMPVSRGQEPEVENAREEQFSPPPAMPSRSLAQAIPDEDELQDEPSGYDPARGTAEAAAVTSFGETAQPGTHESGKRALVQYDYEKAEDNELELNEGEYVTNIEMVDDDWWMGQNARGESGLFPSNYVELVEDDGTSGPPAPTMHEPEPEEALPVPAAGPAGGEGIGSGAVATAIYDYEAAEDNELSFPEGAKIGNVVSVES